MTIHETASKGSGWLLFFYSVPSKPVSNRMKVWRKLLKAGAVQFKGAVYVLPFSEEHYEFLQWLVSEIAAMKGEAAFVKTEKIDTMKDSEIILLFNGQREEDYRSLDKSIEGLERKLNSFRKGTKPQNLKRLSAQFEKMKKQFEEVKKIDFFSSGKGQAAGGKIKRLKADLTSLSGREGKEKLAAPVAPRSVSDFKGKIWVTRKRPFIDRMASAWLIRKYLDRDASFDFIEEKDVDDIGKNAVAFDVRGGEFTHTGDLCTFEVLIKAFGLKDKALRKIAAIVHDLDLKDDKFGAEEAKGLEEILSGIRKTATGDKDALERGMAVFEMLYVSKS